MLRTLCLQSRLVKYHNRCVTIWRPQIEHSGSRSNYEQIADRIEHDVIAGVLLHGSRLPTQRELADTLRITTVTVTRAYREAARRALLASTVGRGTFVRAAKGATAAIDEEIDLSTNVIHGGERAVDRERTHPTAASPDASYGPSAGSERHRAAGAEWLRGSRPDATAARVVVTGGAQQGMFAALAALTLPGDVVLCEQLVYSGLRAGAETFRLPLQPLPSDRFGVLPDAFEHAAMARTARVAYLTPTLQNPTGTILPEKR